MPQETAFEMDFGKFNNDVNKPRDTMTKELIQFKAQNIHDQLLEFADMLDIADRKIAELSKQYVVDSRMTNARKSSEVIIETMDGLRKELSELKALGAVI